MTLFLPPRRWQIIQGAAPAALELLERGSVHAAVCSPPYWAKRDYDPTRPEWAQLGTEDTPEEYVSHLADCFDPLLAGVLRGALFVNIDDTWAGSGGAGGDHNAGGLRAGQPGYEGSGAKRRRVVAKRDPRLGHDRLEGGVTGRSGHGAGGLEDHKPKDLIGIPWLFAQEMKRRGWYWRADIIWAKPNPRPEGPGDRPARAHEYVWLFTPGPRYWWDHYAIQEPARAKVLPQPGGAPPIRLASPKRLRRSVWEIPVSAGYRPPGTRGHYATFPEALARMAIEAATPDIGVCGTCGAMPRRRVERDKLTKQLNHRGWDLPDCGHTWDPVGATVLDLFSGAATTGLAALRRGRSYIGVEPVAANVDMSVGRLRDQLGVAALDGHVTVHDPV